MNYSKFIVFEGIDGSGKSTQCTRLFQQLQAHSIPCHSTHEPHTGAVGSYIRTMLKDSVQCSARDTHVRSGILAHLFAADRYEHLYASGGICDLLSQNTLVLCDRYVYSSLAYQGNSDLQELVRTLNKDFPTPDCVFYFHIDTEEALKRITRTKDSMEQSTFLHEVKIRYERMFETPLYNSQTHERIPVYTVDARCDEETIAQEVLACTLALLNKEHTHESYVTLSKAHQNIS